MSIQKRSGAELCDVTFRRRTTNGETSVTIVGDFNDWSSHEHRMRHVGDSWSLTMALVPGRAYRFRYLVDDARWENDWEADDYVDNAYGGQDSVVDLIAMSPPA